MEENKKENLPFLVTWDMIAALIGKCERTCRDVIADMRKKFNTSHPNVHQLCEHYMISMEQLIMHLKNGGYKGFI